MEAQVVDAVKLLVADVQNESMDTSFADVVLSVAERSVQCFSLNSVQMHGESFVSACLVLVSPVLWSSQEDAELLFFKPVLQTSTWQRSLS